MRPYGCPARGEGMLEHLALHQKGGQPRLNQLDHDGVLADLANSRSDPAVALPAVASPWAMSPFLHRNDKDVHDSARCQGFPSFVHEGHQVPRTKRYPQAPLVQVRLPLQVVAHAPQLNLSVCRFTQFPAGQRV